MSARGSLAAKFSMVLFLAGCGGSSLPKYYELRNLRVIALVADQPEVSPGGTATITPVVSDAFGGGRALTYEAELCSDPGVGLGATPSCAGNPTRVVLSSGTVTGLSAPNYTGPVGTVVANIPATALVGRTSYDQHNGVAWLVTYKITTGQGEQVQSFRRIVVSNKTPKNSNPTLSDIQNSGASLTTLPTSKARLTGSVGAGSAETYQFQLVDGSFSATEETLQISWLTTDGTFQFSRTPPLSSNDFSPPVPAPAGRNVQLIGVLRDDRGGVAYVIKSL